MSRKYWEQRSAWDMYQFMEDAEETADLIAEYTGKPLSSWNMPQEISSRSS